MWRSKNLSFLCLIIGSLAESSSIPKPGDGCEITGFSVFHKNHRKSVQLERTLDQIPLEYNAFFPDITYTGRILLDDYPQKKINIVTNLNTASNCQRPQCVKITFAPQWKRFSSLTIVSIEGEAPFTLHPNKPQKQYIGLLNLTGEAYQSRDCTGMPYSTLTQNVETVYDTSNNIQIKPMIATYVGTNEPVTTDDTKAIGSATCNFIHDALKNGFFYARHFNYTGTPTVFLKDFKCFYERIKSTSTGPVQIEYKFIPSFQVPKDVNPNPFWNIGQVELYEVWPAIINYLMDMPVRTTGVTEEVMSTRVKGQIASTSPYQLYSKIIPTVKPFTQVFYVKDLEITYRGTGGVPVTSRDRNAVADATCGYIVENLPHEWNTESVTLSDIKCRLKSSSDTKGAFRLLYDVIVTVSVGPSLTPDSVYLENKEHQDFFAFGIERMFEDRFGRLLEPTKPEMSTKVKEAIGPSNPFYSYTGVEIKQFISY
jgi:hypothetical protein